MNDYPPLLKDIYDPPWVLFCKGNLSLLKNENLLAVVGTRDASVNELQVLKKLFPTLIKKEWYDR